MRRNTRVLDDMTLIGWILGVAVQPKEQFIERYRARGTKGVNIRIRYADRDNYGAGQYEVKIYETRRKYNPVSPIPDIFVNNHASERPNLFGKIFPQKTAHFSKEIAVLNAIEAAEVLEKNGIETTINGMPFVEYAHQENERWKPALESLYGSIQRY